LVGLFEEFQNADIRHIPQLLSDHPANGARSSFKEWPSSSARCSMTNLSDFSVKVRHDRDIIVSKPEAGFEVTYRREVYYPMLIASDVLRNDFDESKVTLLVQAWKLALNKAKSLGWLDEQKRRGRRR
jgi:hypothetical protein